MVPAAGGRYWEGAMKHRCKYCGVEGKYRVETRLYKRVYWTCHDHRPTGAGAEAGVSPNSLRAIGVVGRWLRALAGI